MEISENEERTILVTNNLRKSRIQLGIFGIFLLTGILFKIRGAKLPLMAIEMLGILLLINLFFCYLALKIWPKQTTPKVSKGYFILQTIELIVLLMTTHFLGITLSWGGLFLIIYILFCFLVFTQIIYSWLSAFVSGSGYLILAGLEHWRVLKNGNFYTLSNQSFSFFSITISLVAGLILFFALYLGSFLKSWQILKEEKEKLKTEKFNLEQGIKVKEREIKELNQKLNEQIERGEEKLQKIRDLERFKRFAIDREIKMRELKKEIGKLKENFKSKQTRYDSKK
jgi:hypothetical protein